VAGNVIGGGENLAPAGGFIPGRTHAGQLRQHFESATKTKADLKNPDPTIDLNKD
jgi:hypothetical protein